jgi:RNase P protein component
MDTTPSIPELAQAVADLELLDDIDRVIAARALVQSLPQQLAAIADAATYDATREVSQPTVAVRLGVTKSQVERAITRHRARVALAP